MGYRDQLARHHPFKIVPPIEFAPFAHRSVSEAQRLLRRSGLKETDPHRIAQLFDTHLDALAQHFSNSQKNRSRLLALGYPGQTKAALRSKVDAHQLRGLVPDLDLLKASQQLIPHLLKVPPGLADIPDFVKVGVLALWKVADAIDAIARGKSPRMHVMQAIDAANFSMQLFESEVSALEESAAFASGQADGATQDKAYVELEKSIIGKEKNAKRLKYYFEAKVIALELVKELHISSHKEAVSKLPDELTKRNKVVAESTIRDWFTGFDFSNYCAKEGRGARLPKILVTEGGAL